MWFYFFPWMWITEEEIKKSKKFPYRVSLQYFFNIVFISLSCRCQFDWEEHFIFYIIQYMLNTIRWTLHSMSLKCSKCLFKKLIWMEKENLDDLKIERAGWGCGKYGPVDMLWDSDFTAFISTFSRSYEFFLLWMAKRFPLTFSFLVL